MEYHSSPDPSIGNHFDWRTPEAINGQRKPAAFCGNHWSVSVPTSGPQIRSKHIYCHSHLCGGQWPMINYKAILINGIHQSTLELMIDNDLIELLPLFAPNSYCGPLPNFPLLITKVDQWIDGGLLQKTRISTLQEHRHGWCTLQSTDHVWGQLDIHTVQFS